MSEKRPVAWVFAGCGGTFYHAMSQYLALAYVERPNKILFVDPDTIGDGANPGRQWHGEEEGKPKSFAALDYFDRSLGTREDEKVDAIRASFPVDPKMHNVNTWTKGYDVVLIHNVDNNEARVAAREWCQQRQNGITAMVVSGCSDSFGQVWLGLWDEEQGEVHDWLYLHPETREPAKPQPYGQNAMANAMTGLLSAKCLDFFACLLEFKRGSGIPLWAETLPEFYWEESLHGFKTWIDEVKLTTQETMGEVQNG